MPGRSKGSTGRGIKLKGAKRRVPSIKNRKSLKGGPSKPFTHAHAGSGGRFKACEARMRHQGARDPGAVCAAIGRSKFGKKQFQGMAAHGRKH
jgi:hypothetical protein